jgi:NDP-sugar pyrophosphorylase family protein
MTSRISSLSKAVLLAAGKGTRMKELTAELPKPMIPIKGRPVLEWIVKGLASTGFKKILIITGYREEVVRNHFGDGSEWGVSIEYVRQVVQDGTGKVIELAKEFVGQDPFLLGYGDILVADEIYQEIRACWESEQSDMLISVKLGEDLRKGGTTIFDDHFRLQELTEKPSDEEIGVLRKQFGDFKPWYNAGVYVFNSKVFEYTAKLQKSPRGEYELTDAIRQMAKAGLHVRGLPIHGYWVDVRDPEVLAQVEKEFELKGRTY